MTSSVDVSIDLPSIHDEKILNIVFTHQSLGLTTPNFAGTTSRQPLNNLKLAHIGDAVIGSVVVRLVAKRYPDLDLGQAALKDHLVSNATLTAMCHAFGLFDKLKASAAILNLRALDTKHHADLFEAYVGGLVACDHQNRAPCQEGGGLASFDRWLFALFAIAADHFVEEVAPLQKVPFRPLPTIHWVTSSPSPLHRLPREQSLSTVNDIFQRQQQRLEYTVEWHEKSTKWIARCQLIVNGQKCRYEAMGSSKQLAKQAVALLLCRRLGLSR